MTKNTILAQAKKAKNDEFYTRYEDIQTEINAYLEYNSELFRDKMILCPCDDPEWSNFTKFFAQNFENFGIKKLVSTSYATDSKNKNAKEYQFTLFDFLTKYEQESPQYDKTKTASHGKIFVLDRNKKRKRIDIHDLNWDYLKGDGNFRSEEVKKLRDEADIIITNPPFSLFREFMGWIREARKEFLIIGNQNAITYKEIFPLIKENKIWLGVNAVKEFEFWKENKEIRKFGNVGWFANIEHGRRHKPLQLMNMADNLRYNKRLIKKLEIEYQVNTYPKYDNYEAIEVPYSDAIPSDYDGVMGVPITFLDKYCPDQFEIVGVTDRQDSYNFRTHKYVVDEYKNANDLNARACILVDNIPKALYARILIRYTREWIEQHPGDFKNLKA